MKPSTKIITSVAVYLIGGGLGFGGTKLVQSLMQDGEDMPAHNVVTPEPIVRPTTPDTINGSSTAATDNAITSTGSTTTSTGSATTTSTGSATSSTDSTTTTTRNSDQSTNISSSTVSTASSYTASSSSVTNGSSATASSTVKAPAGMSEKELQQLLNIQSSKLQSGIKNKVSPTMSVSVVERNPEDIKNVSDATDVFQMFMMEQWRKVQVTGVQRDADGVIIGVTVKPVY